MSIAVLIVTWNNVHTISACIESIVRQSGINDVSVYVWDNNSADSTADIVASFPNVSLVRSVDNRGFAHGVNRLAERSKEDLIVLLNPDAELCDGSLASLAETAERQGAAVVGGCLASPDGEVQLASARPFPTALTLARWLLTRRSQVWAMPDRRTSVDAVSGAFMLIHRELWTKVGGLDEAYPHAGEDLAICLAAKRAGADVIFEPRSRAVHIGETSVAQAPAEIDVLRWIGSVRFAREYEGRFRAALLRAVLCVYSASALAMTATGFARSPRSARRARLLWKWAVLGLAPQLPELPAVAAGAQ
jgi:N-acetylglucosaminyl-diphospho-decaprenol L-rhamnosyltransferase